MQRSALVQPICKELRCCDWAGRERSAATFLRVEHWPAHDDVRSLSEAPQGAVSVHRAKSTTYHKQETLRFLLTTTPTLVDGRSPPGRLWRTHTPQPHEHMHERSLIYNTQQERHGNHLLL